ncbi:pseudouridine synthase [Mycoplasmopsis adleri]|uniref:pseudouridine synthase n=1 Tax=Mycoplasmopsis adleri TaxID=51362 RepID=UPI0038733C57
MPLVRIEKYIADITGISRNEIKNKISKKAIKVNDQIITKSIKINIEKDQVKLDNVLLKYEKYHYFMFNKPAGFVCANEDNNDATIFDILKLDKDKYFSFGRLDKDTEGLLIISNDGLMCHKLLSPKYHVAKKYFVEVDKPFSEEFKNSHPDIKLDEDTIIKNYEYELIDNKHCFLTIYEGKFHQVKKMLGHFGYAVLYLKRVQIGKLKLDNNLAKGAIRKLSEEEVLLMQEQ